MKFYCKWQGFKGKLVLDLHPKSGVGVEIDWRDLGFAKFFTLMWDSQHKLRVYSIVLTPET